MLDTSNYSKTSTKVIQSSEDFAARAHLCANGENGFVWPQHGLSSKHPLDPTECCKLMANHPVPGSSSSFLPGEQQWGMSGG